MSAKDNFAQAMKELLNGTETDKAAEEKKVTTSSFSSFSAPRPRAEQPRG